MIQPVKINPSMSRAVVGLRNKIRRGYSAGIPEDQSTAAERQIVYKYPQYFENDRGYIKVKVTGKRRTKNPYKSEAQRRKFHAMEARGEISKATVNEFDRASKGKRLPKKANATASEFKQHQKVRLQDLVRKFQGHANGLKHRLLEADTAPKHKYLLGCLALMKVKANGKIIPIEFNGAAYLAADLRNNLHAVGKDAIILNVKKPNPGNLKELGKLVQIDYITAKSHIENGETVRFWHKLGEVDGEHPTLYIDSDGFPIINGGGYDIWDVGIVN